MRIIATAQGFILYFESIDDLKGLIQNLSGQLEWVKSKNIEPPFLYASYDERMPKQEIEKLLDELKKP
jgi:hypothetical protein